MELVIAFVLCGTERLYCHSQYQTLMPENDKSNAPLIDQLEQNMNGFYLREQQVRV